MLCTLLSSPLLSQDSVVTSSSSSTATSTSSSTHVAESDTDWIEIPTDRRKKEAADVDPEAEFQVSRFFSIICPQLVFKSLLRLLLFPFPHQYFTLILCHYLFIPSSHTVYSSAPRHIASHHSTLHYITSHHVTSHHTNSILFSPLLRAASPSLFCLFMPRTIQ
jgi:hypothetical protein